MKKNLFILFLAMLSLAGVGPLSYAQGGEGSKTLTVPCTLSADNNDFYAKISGIWEYNSSRHTIHTYVKALGDRVPVYSNTGIEMEPGVYTAVLIYQAGYYLEGTGESGEFIEQKWVDPFSVKFGAVGAEVDDMQEVYVDYAACTNGKLAEVRFDFVVNEKGTYTFAFEPLMEYRTNEDVFAGYELGFQQISVSRLYKNDVEIARVESSLAHRTTLEQANGKYSFETLIRNSGSGTTDVQLAYYWEDDMANPFYTHKNIASMPSGDLGRFLDTIEFSGIETLGERNIVVKANLMGEGVVDSNAYNNSYVYRLQITDSILAYDSVGDDLWGVYRPSMGRLFAPISCALPYTLTHPDTLTSVTFAFAAPTTDVIPVSFRIHRWDSEKEEISYELYSKDFERPQDSGYFTYTFRPMYLQPGSYLLELAQRNDDYIGLYADEEDYGYTWITSSTPIKKQTGIGFVVARMNFGRVSGDLHPIDLSVSSIDRPDASGVFTQNQLVQASVYNQGTVPSGGKVYCMVNGSLLEDVVDLPVLDPFEKTTVKFNADLQAAGEYEIKVFTVVEGDNYSENDTMVKNVVSLGTPDNYVMDFEYCDDFAYTNLTPWSVRDVDTNMTIGITGLTIPFAGQRMAFMAYDNAGIPGAEGVDFNWMKPPQGRLAGMCLEANPGPNDDWLISPKLKMPESGSSVTFRVASMHRTLSEYEVLVSTTNALPKNFQRIGDVRKAEEALNGKPWSEVTVDLSEYDGKSVYIAIRCVQKPNALALLIDDIRVKKPGDAAVEGEDLSAYLRVYPNPASQQITIDGSGLDIRRVEILNLYGGRVYDSGNMNNQTCLLSVESWASGMYFARVTTDKGVHTLKFVVR